MQLLFQVPLVRYPEILKWTLTSIDVHFQSIMIYSELVHKIKVYTNSLTMDCCRPFDLK